ncbi:MAG: hypothetical protein IH921_07030 [Gemmatimonadetes bacterium]|nr:hypothetical protein [Gemmatimonadota bacterium]
MRRWYVLSAIGMLTLGIAVGFRPGSAEYTALDARGNPLRTAFNDDLGKVRVLMLVAPT